MDKIIAFVTKVVSWVMVNGATLIGCVQALVKAIKELLTGVVNLLSIFMSAEAAENMVKTVRAAMNWVDDLLEKIKGYLIK